MAADFSPSTRPVESWDEVGEALDAGTSPPDRCPTCGHQGRTRASESRKLPQGPRQRRRRCGSCGDSWFTVEIGRDALLDLTERLLDAEEQLADLHAGDLHGAVHHLRGALKALETPYKARIQTEEKHRGKSLRRGSRTAQSAQPEGA